MGTWGITHWVILLVIVLVIFGTKKLRNIGQDLGGAVKGFKEGMKGAEDEATPPKEPPEVPPQHIGTTIEGQATKDKV